jgi:hypothetical protein
MNAVSVREALNRQKDECLASLKVIGVEKVFRVDRVHRPSTDAISLKRHEC